MVLEVVQGQELQVEIVMQVLLDLPLEPLVQQILAVEVEAVHLEVQVLVALAALVA
jgi:hypothetical protein